MDDRAYVFVVVHYVVLSQTKAVLPYGKRDLKAKLLVEKSAAFGRLRGDAARKSESVLYKEDVICLPSDADCTDDVHPSGHKVCQRDDRLTV